MKSNFLLLSFLLVTLSVSAVTKVKTQNFVVTDSIRVFEQEDQDGVGYKFSKHLSVDWPVTVNGKKSAALTKFLLDSVFGANQHRDIYTSYTDDIKVLKGYVSMGVHRALRESDLVKEFIVKEPGEVANIYSEEWPMSCWYEDMELKVDRIVGDLVFFSAYYDDYYGGAHNMFATRYLAFDANLNKPINLKDIVASPKKLLRLLPNYDKRDADVKWWKDIEVDDIDNFYIDGGKLVFSFSPYAIGPFADGQVEVPVPLKTLRAKGLLTPYGKKLIK